MDRLAKSMRIGCGIVLLANLAGWFLPWVSITQENYPTLTASLWNYIYALLGGKTDALTMTASDAFTGTQKAIIIVCMLLAAAIILLFGIWGVVGGPKQLVTGIGTLVNLTLQITLYCNRELLWTLGEDQKACMEFGSMFLLIGAIVAALPGIATFFIRPRVRHAAENTEIPQLQEIKEQQLQAKYNVVQEEAPVQQSSSQQTPPTANVPHGTLVGITGIYKGAQITLKDGEMIRLGRKPENDLIFADEMHVSRRHCQITWDAARSQYRLYDTSSTGTYMNGREEPLPQNMEVWLDTGVVLDIGDSSNRFSLV